MRNIFLGLACLLATACADTDPRTNAESTPPPSGAVPQCSAVAFDAPGAGLNPAAFTQAVNKVRAAPCSCPGRSFGAVGAVRWNAKLEAAALAHSRDMQRNNFFSHTGSDGSTLRTRVERQGYTWSALGENIAAGQPDMNTVLRGWLRSTSGHCEAIKSANYAEIGAALVSGASSNTFRTYWTLDFGKPR